MDVVGLKRLEALDDGAFVAERAHGVRVHAVAGLRHGIHIPGQLARVRPAAGTGHRRVDQDQPAQAGGPGPAGAHPDAPAHGMPDQAVSLQSQRLRERQYVRGLRVQAVVQRGAGLRQPAAPHVQDVGIERLAETFADEAPCDRRAGDARHDHDGVPTRGVRTAVAQVVLADAVGVDVAAVEVGTGRIGAGCVAHCGVLE
ncbi:hypothetical protein G6F24_014590 [Rhizopus arrhizus]|nr:hypothetical protein G6F24_014590 [Rhizopus arrhizus]